MFRNHHPRSLALADTPTFRQLNTLSIKFIRIKVRRAPPLDAIILNDCYWLGFPAHLAQITPSLFDHLRSTFCVVVKSVLPGHKSYSVGLAEQRHPLIYFNRIYIRTWTPVRGLALKLHVDRAVHVGRVKSAIFRTNFNIRVGSMHVTFRYAVAVCTCPLSINKEGFFSYVDGLIFGG
jgi:hypothetical protein